MQLAPLELELGDDLRLSTIYPVSFGLVQFDDRRPAWGIHPIVPTPRCFSKSVRCALLTNKLGNNSSSCTNNVNLSYMSAVVS